MPKKKTKELMKKAEEYLKKKDLDSAIEAYEEAHRLDSENTEVIQKLNELHFKAGNLDKSKEYFLKLIKINPEYTEEDTE